MPNNKPWIPDYTIVADSDLAEFFAEDSIAVEEINNHPQGEKTDA